MFDLFECSREIEQRFPENAPNLRESVSTSGRFLNVEGNELGAWQFRGKIFKRSEPTFRTEWNIPSFLGKDGPNSKERGTYTNPIVTATAQVLSSHSTLSTKQEELHSGTP